MIGSTQEKGGNTQVKGESTQDQQETQEIREGTQEKKGGNHRIIRGARKTIGGVRMKAGIGEMTKRKELVLQWVTTAMTVDNTPIILTTLQGVVEAAMRKFVAQKMKYVLQKELTPWINMSRMKSPTI